jgi:hypothetical protein
MIVTKTQLSAKLAGSYPQVWLLATDNTALRLQDGRKRSLSPGTPGNPQPYAFFLPASNYSFIATSASPAVFTAVGSSYASGTPRTTMRYDRARQNLDRHPNYILWGSITRSGLVGPAGWDHR